MTTSLLLRTLKLPDSKGQTGPEVFMGRLGNSIALFLVNPGEDDPAIWLMLSTIVLDDPFPGFSAGGNEMIWVKNYSENEGILDILERAGWLRSSGRTIKQGFITYPLCEIRLLPSEISQYCPSCERNEQVGDTIRYLRCSVCRKTRYCSIECQQKDWKSHKLDCKLLKAGKLAEVENNMRKRKEKMMESMGFKTVTL